MFYKLSLFGILVTFSLDMVVGFNMNNQLKLKSRITRNSPATSIDEQPSLDPEHTEVNRSLLDWYNSQMSLTSTHASGLDFKDGRLQHSTALNVNESTKNDIQQITNSDVNDGPADYQDPLDTHDSTNQPGKRTKKPKPKNKLRKQQGKSENRKSRRGKGIGDALQTTGNQTSNTETPVSIVTNLEENGTHSSQELAAVPSKVVSSPASSIVSGSNVSLTYSNVSLSQSTGNASITSSSVIMISTEAPYAVLNTVNGSEVKPANTSSSTSAQPTVIGLLILLTITVFIGLGVWWGWWRMKRRQQERLRLQLLPVYNYDPADDQDDWENRLLGESTGLKPKDKVHFYGQ